MGSDQPSLKPQDVKRHVVSMRALISKCSTAGGRRTVVGVREVMEQADKRRAELQNARELGPAVARLAESQMLEESQLEDVGAWGTLVVTRLVFPVDDGAETGATGEAEQAEMWVEALQAPQALQAHTTPQESTRDTVYVTRDQITLLARKVREAALRPGNGGKYYGVLEQLVLRYGFTSYRRIKCAEYGAVLAFVTGLTEVPSEPRWALF